MKNRGTSARTRLRLLSGNQCIRVQSGRIEENPQSADEGRIVRWYLAAGKTPPSKRSIVTASVCTIVISAFIYSLFGVTAVCVPICWCGFYISMNHRIRKRAELFELDYTAFLLSLASSIRTGLDPLVAFGQCATLFPSNGILAQEIRKTVLEVEAGIGEERAFRNFALHIAHPDVDLLRAALVFSRRQGSSLGSCLHRLARVTRQRQSFRRKMKGAVAMQRLSAFGIGACAVFVGIIQGTSNPQGIRDAWEHSVGRSVLCAGLFLVVGGLFWMIHMSRRRL